MTQTDPGSLTQYGRMAEKHWREFRPKMVRDLEARGKLQETLREAQERTKDEMADLTGKLLRQNYTPDQAQRTAWEMVRENHILLPPENPEA
jgi:hypothetical protein